MRHEDVLVATGRCAGSRRDQSRCGRTLRQLSRSAATEAVRRAGAAEYQSFRVVLRGRCPSGPRRGPALGQQPEHERRTWWAAVFCRSPFWWLGSRPTSGIGGPDPHGAVSSGDTAAAASLPLESSRLSYTWPVAVIMAGCVRDGVPGWLAAFAWRTSHCAPYCIACSYYPEAPVE